MKHTIGVANSSLFGLNFGIAQEGFLLPDYEENYIIHPLIRNDWRSADRLREALGFLPCIRTGVDGTSYVNETSVGAHPSAFVGTNPFLSQTALLAAGSIQYTLPGGPNHWSPSHILTSTGLQPTYEFDLIFNTEMWNAQADQYVPIHGSAGQQANMMSLLHRNLLGTEYEGVPYFVRYFGPNTEGIRSGLLTTDPRMAGAHENVDPIIRATDLDVDIFDHCFQYSRYDMGPSDDYNIEVNSYYNFYLDTDPDYESFVGQTDVVEALIPNYYMMEITRADQGPDGIPNSGDATYPYNQELSPHPTGTPLTTGLGLSPILTPMALRGLTSPGQVYNSWISQGYFQYYTKRLSVLNPGKLQSLSDTYNSIYKDIAVLTPEIQSGLLRDYNMIAHDNRGTTLDSAARDDDLLAIAAYPYYNQIIIPYENQFGAGQSGHSFYDDLNTYMNSSDDAERFLTFLQLYVCYNYHGASSSLLSNMYDRPDSGPNKPLLEQNVSIPLLLDLEHMLQQLNDSNSDLVQLAQQLITFYDNKNWITENFSNNTPLSNAHPSFVPLRTDFSQNRYFTSPTLPNDDPVPSGYSTTAAQAFFNPGTGITSQLGDIAEGITGLTRMLGQVYEGVGGGENGGYAPSDPLMYVVEKRAIPPGQLSADLATAPVQTFFFGRDYYNAAKKGVVYNDTQIKYGVRYQYDIKQVRLVFGNRYRYLGPNDAGAGTTAIIKVPDFGRALGNALGFFAEENSLITSTRTFQDIEAKTNGTFRPGNPKIFNPPNHAPIWTRRQDFRYLSESGENTYSKDGSGYWGYYVYRFPQGETGESQPYYNFQYARQYGVLYGGSVEFPLNDPRDQYMDLSAINIKLIPGDGFGGNWTGGAIPGTPPEIEIIETPDEPPVDLDLAGQLDRIPIVEPKNQLPLVDALNIITTILGAEWADQTEDWANSSYGSLDDLVTILAQAGALPDQGGGVDPRGPAGGLGGDMVLAMDLTQQSLALENLLEGLGIAPPGGR